MGVGVTYAQEDGVQPADNLTVPPPTDGNKTLLVKVQVTQPYIDKVATRVTYDGIDRVFGIEWRHSKAHGTLRVLDAWVMKDRVVSDIYDDPRVGISMPARYTPITTPRLFPYLIAVREKWGKQFDEMAHASAKIAAISLVATMRPVTSPLTARAASTPRPAPFTNKATPPRATVVNAKSSNKPAPKAAPKPNGKPATKPKSNPASKPNSPLCQHT